MSTASSQLLSKLSTKLVALLSVSKLKKLALDTGFIKRKGKLTGLSFALLNITSLGATGFSSLTELCMKLSKDFGILISKQGLDSRYTDSGSNFMKKVLGHLFKIQICPVLSSPNYPTFSGIYVRDATSIQLPSCLATTFKGSGGSASKSGLKIDLTYNLLSDDLHLFFRDAASADSSCEDGKPVKGGLYLQDLGYFKLARFEHIANCGAFFLSRYKQSTNIYVAEKEDKELDIIALCKSLQVDELFEQAVFLGAKKRLPVRLVIQKVPAQVAAERKRKMKAKAKRQGKRISKTRLALTELTLLITNVKPEELTAFEVLKTYKIRWQVELLFKGWKSIHKFDAVHAVKPTRFLAMMYGRMIWILISMKTIQVFQQICWPKHKFWLSELKLFKMLAIYRNTFNQSLLKGETSLQVLLKAMLKAALVLAKKEQKKGNPNPLFSKS